MFFKKDKDAKKREKESKAYENAIPQSITDSIPYVAVYESGIIEVKPGVFSQSYIIPPVNFKTANDNEQWRLAELYSEFMNSFDSGVTVEITIYNRTIDIGKNTTKCLPTRCLAQKIISKLKKYSQ